MCTLLKGAINSLAYKQNAMNGILQSFILEKIRSFLDDIPIKGCAYEPELDESIKTDGFETIYIEACAPLKMCKTSR